MRSPSSSASPLSYKYTQDAYSHHHRITQLRRPRLTGGNLVSARHPLASHAHRQDFRLFLDPSRSHIAALTSRKLLTQVSRSQILHLDGPPKNGTHHIVISIYAPIPEVYRKGGGEGRGGVQQRRPGCQTDRNKYLKPKEKSIRWSRTKESSSKGRNTLSVSFYPSPLSPFLLSPFLLLSPLKESLDPHTHQGPGVITGSYAST